MLGRLQFSRRYANFAALSKTVEKLHTKILKSAENNVNTGNLKKKRIHPRSEF